MGIEKSTGSSIRRRSFELSLFAIRAIHGHAWNDTISWNSTEFPFESTSFLSREIRKGSGMSEMKRRTRAVENVEEVD